MDRLISVSTPALSGAETVEVEMLNRGEKGSMVFEPDFLALQPGDSVKFIATNKSHNAATIDGMVPDGHPGFRAGSMRRSSSPSIGPASTASNARRISASAW